MDTTIPMGSFLSVERWPRQRAAADTEVWTERQQTAGEGRELGERRANKETNKQRARQTKGPSAGDRQTSGKKPTERHWSARPRLGNVRRALSVSVSQSGSLLEWRGLLAHCVCISIFLGVFVLHTLSLPRQSP